MITIKALPPSRRPSLLPRASTQGFAQSIMQKYRHGEGRDPGYLALIHRDFSPSIGGQENHFYQTFLHVRMQVLVDSYLGLNREMLPIGQAGLSGSKERVVTTQALGSGRKVRSATLLHELFRKWESSNVIGKVYLPRITVVSKGRDRYRWSSYVQSSIQRGSSLEKWLPLGRFKEQRHPADFASPLLKAMISDSKETVRERIWTPETPYVSSELWVHTARMGDPGERRSLQSALERIRLESATRIDAIVNSRVRETRSEAGRFGQSGVRYFLQLIGRGMEQRVGKWSFPILQKRAEVRAASSFLDRSMWTEKAGNDGRDIARLIVHESESTRWSVASRQTELWGHWWENLSLYWQQSQATWLPDSLSEVSSSPLELKILQSNELSMMFPSVLLSMLHRADVSRTKQQAIRERFKQLFLLSQQVPKADKERGQARHGSPQRLKQIEQGREQQSGALSHWLRQLVIRREQQATMLVSRVETKQPSNTLHPLQLLPFESIVTRNQWTYEIAQQLISQEARLNEIVREQSVRLRSSPEQAPFGKTSMSPAVSRASYQQLDILQHEWRTGLSLHVLHPMQGLPLQLQTALARTVPPPLSQSVVKKSIASVWIRSIQSANFPVFFEKRGWSNRPWITEYLEAPAKINREPADRTTTAQLVWNRFSSVYHVNRQRWQSLQERIVSFTQKQDEHFVSRETNRNAVMDWVHIQQMAAKQLRETELLAARIHAPWNLTDRPRNQSPYPAASTRKRWSMYLLNVLTKERASVSHHEATNHIESTPEPLFHPHIHFLQNRHVFQNSYEIVRQLLPVPSRKNKREEIAFFKDREKFIRHERKVTSSMVSEREQRPTSHTVSLKNERSTSRPFMQVRSHNREALFHRFNRLRSAIISATEWIGLGGTDHQRLYNTSAEPFSIREDVTDRNSLRQTAAGWSAELGLTILLQKKAKLAAMSEFAMLGSTSGKAAPSKEKQTNDQSRSRRVESNQYIENSHSRDSSRSRFLQQTSLWTNPMALRARPYLQVMEQIRKAIQTEPYSHNHHSLSTVVKRHDAPIVVQKVWGPIPSLVHGQSVGMAMQPPLLQAVQQGQRASGKSEPRSLSENATYIHRRPLRTEDSHASPAATVQSPPSTLPLQRQVDLHVPERAGNQTSLSPQEVDRLMDKMMKELDKRLTQERQRRGL